MADIFSGYKRSLKCYVSKKLNGVVDVGYPKQYPTATDIANGYFTYNSVQYDIPTSEELSNMSQASYDSLLTTFKLYVESIEAGASFATDTIVQPTIYDPSGCAVDIPTTTTTSTTAIPEPEPGSTYDITSDQSGYGNEQTVFNITGAVVDDIITLKFRFSSILLLEPGYSSATSKLYVEYTYGDAQSQGQCSSNGGEFLSVIEKYVSFIVSYPETSVYAVMTIINSTIHLEDSFLCAIDHITRNGVDYTVEKAAFGGYNTQLIAQFSC